MDSTAVRSKTYAGMCVICEDTQLCKGADLPYGIGYRFGK